MKLKQFLINYLLKIMLKVTFTKEFLKNLELYSLSKESLAKQVYDLKVFFEIN
jgi:hypothetical protein